MNVVGRIRRRKRKRKRKNKKKEDEINIMFRLNTEKGAYFT